MKALQEPPDGIIITVGEKMYGHHGYRVWLRNFEQMMILSDGDIVDSQDFYYYFRQANQPKAADQVRHLYLCIGNRIRMRVIYAGSAGPEVKIFSRNDSDQVRRITGKAWVIAAGPIERAPHKIVKKGFRGFRYTQALW